MASVFLVKLNDQMFPLVHACTVYTVQSKWISVVQLWPFEQEGYLACVST